MLKQILLLLTVLLYSTHVNAQKAGNVRLNIEVGVLPLPSTSELFASFLKVEPKISVAENTLLGLRMGITFNSHQFEDADLFAFMIDKMINNAILSFVPSLDYYWNTDKYDLYLGFGAGVQVETYEIEAFRTFATNPAERVVKGQVKKRPSLLLRGGVERAKWRYGLEYNFIPKAEIVLPDGVLLGTVRNSYLGVSIGRVIGG